jgi:hypothetical protein
MQFVRHRNSLYWQVGTMCKREGRPGLAGTGTVPETGRRERISDRKRHAPVAKRIEQTGSLSGAIFARYC